MDIRLSRQSFEVLQNLNFFHELNNTTKLLPDEQSIHTEDFDRLLIKIDEEIMVYGVTDDQEELNNYGRNLYILYDEILYSSGETT